MGEKFAVIDTETNWENNVMSVGIVISEDGQFDMIDSKYLIFKDAAKVGGMFSYALIMEGQSPEIFTKSKGIKIINEYLKNYGVESIYAYNASFDKRCLPELYDYRWHDILRIAAYKQYNPAIPPNSICCGTGRLKSGYKVENILRMFGEDNYEELHNALTDAIDELRIMNYLKHPIDRYPSI